LKKEPFVAADSTPPGGERSKRSFSREEKGKTRK